MIKLLIDKYAHACVAANIPTGDLYRSITQNQLIKAHNELYEALKEQLAEATNKERQRCIAICNEYAERFYKVSKEGWPSKGWAGERSLGALDCAIRIAQP